MVLGVEPRAADKPDKGSASQLVPSQGCPFLSAMANSEFYKYIYLELVGGKTYVGGVRVARTRTIASFYLVYTWKKGSQEFTILSFCLQGLKILFYFIL